MAIGQRIKFFRNLRGMTQRYLGVQVGFPESSADIRMAQYESEKRIPKEELSTKLANVLGVNPNAITIPNIDSYLGLIHTLFALEDIYDINIDKIDGQLCLKISPENRTENIELYEILNAWQEQAEKMRNGEITKEEYDNWRYTYPQLDESHTFAKTPGDTVNDAMLDAFKGGNLNV